MGMPALALDNSTFISAQEFITAQNRGERSPDPFARQSYVELVQSLIFQPAVRVIHPVHLNPTSQQFGDEPYLLRRLLELRLVTPVQVSADSMQHLAAAESDVLTTLQTRGVDAMLSFLRSMEDCDHEAEAAGRPGLRRRILQWNDFHQTQIPHHLVRVPTTDGIEPDRLGEWARAASLAIGELFRPLMPSAVEPSNFIAALARSLRYQARATVTGHAYQPHGLRRDFAVTSQILSDGMDEETAVDVIKLIRGIHDRLSENAGPSRARHLELLRLELPLVGGRLWNAEEAGLRTDREWIDLVCDRIMSYRAKAGPLRELVRGIRTEEDTLRFQRGIEEVTQRLNERLGLSTVDITPLEAQLAEGVSSVASAVPGVPTVGGLWIGARATLKRYAFRGNIAQKFVYQEYLSAWRRANN
ncbi:hypothetical protein [Streptomyces sp. SID5643]|uniref:hypothetical protein n=1 Tax=Streptomyces sp. SID5643 TaxID=2690307 RepID=UPI00136A3A84|nr:hypothetical protein [Streptomyces sp. SID5643]MZF84277.1 hypothetical protein [Streptomyces sp. SID5643]MZF85620.1 hypothetical protein [Streptomyces sp. SID5643]